MAVLIDTNIAIELRDRTPAILHAIEIREARPAVSILSWIELEGGVHKSRALASDRRASLDLLLSRIDIIDLDHDIVRTYGEIVGSTGFSRARIIDRVIAATAIVHGLTLITINGSDFGDIPDLKLEIWPSPQ